MTEERMTEVSNLIIEKLSETEAITPDLFFDFIYERRLLFLLYPIYEKMVLENSFDNSYIRHVKVFEDKTRQMHLQEKELLKICGILNSKGINYLVIKGMILSKIIYDNHKMRDSGDIDILVKKDDMVRVYEELFKEGYRFCEGVDEQGNDVLSETPDYLYSKDYHEFSCLKLFENDDYVEVEVKHATSAIPYKYIKMFWEEVEEVTINGLNIKTFGTTNTLLHIIAHLYENSQCDEGFITNSFFRDFVDLKMFINKYRSTIDWEELKDKSMKCKNEHKVYFSLDSVNKLWPGTVERKVIDMFDISKRSYASNCNIHGEIFDWDTDIVKRSFDEGLRLQEYSRLYKKRIFENINPAKVIKKDHIDLQICGEVYSYKVHAELEKKEKRVRIAIFGKKETNNRLKICYEVAIIPNKDEKELINYNVNNLSRVSWNNLTGRWDSSENADMQVEMIDIELGDQFDCNAICLCIDSWEKIGKVGFRGTGAKDKFYILNQE